LIAYGRELGAGSLPNRLFEYMASGLAVIAPQYAREIADIVESEQCGILVDFEDPEDVARAISFLSENRDQCRAMGARGRRAFESRFNWEDEVEPFLDKILQLHKV
jgi:glycosyltransferase involved in cell wall biosynthesis